MNKFFISTVWHDWFPIFEFIVFESILTMLHHRKYYYCNRTGIYVNLCSSSQTLNIYIRHNPNIFTFSSFMCTNSLEIIRYMFSSCKKWQQKKRVIIKIKPIQWTINSLNLSNLSKRWFNYSYSCCSMN